ncbi:MAG: DUF697 domain-containing protein [Alphaproteobacteria bacterium]|nr:DUF697 domain-containing protein [Alphaproteobacteria bacterium]
MRPDEADRTQDGLEQIAGREFRIAELAPAPDRLDTPDIDPPPDAGLPHRPHRARRVFVWSLAASILAILGLQVFDFLAALYRENLITGGVVTALLALTLGSGLLWARAELRGIFRLEAVDAVREKALRIATGASVDEADGLIEDLIRVQAHRPGIAHALHRLRRLHGGKLADRELLRILDARILGPCDEEAVAAVDRHARRAAIAVAASPVAVLDAVILVGLALSMIREVAEVYGMRPGRLASVRIARRLLGGTAMVMGADIAGTMILEQFGKTIGTVVAVKGGEAAIAGLRMLRLGQMVIQEVRPVPALEAERGRISRSIARAMQLFAGSPRREETPPAREP